MLPMRFARRFVVALATTLLACQDSGSEPGVPLDPAIRYRLVSISDRPLPTIYYQGGSYDARADSGYLQFGVDGLVDLVTYRSVLYPGSPPEPQAGIERVLYRREGTRVLIARSATTWDTATIRGREITAHFRHDGMHDLGEWLYRP